MQINIVAFGDLTEIIGQRSLTLQNVHNTDQLRLQLHRLYPALKNTVYQIALDKEIVSANKRLKDNQMIALLPATAKQE
jgi:sulfur-carrier protein